MRTGKKLVVVDTDIPQLMDNKIFNKDLATKISHTILPLCYLFEEAKKQGIEMVTADVYFKDYGGEPALLMSALTGPYTKKLIKAGVQPMILTCAESPFIATHFYINLNKISGAYKHSFVFSGMKKQLNTKTIYHQMLFPQPYSYADTPQINYENKNFLTAIVSAKGMDKFKSLIKSLLLKLFYGLGVKEIYSERRRAINYFSNQTGFDLYGYGWDKIKSNDLSGEVIKKCYRGTAKDKLEVLNKYRFALCFENAIFPGYVTEKIFDVMNAGSIPIYYGAPDIKDFVPANCFIDMRNFNSYQELHKYLLQIDKEEYNKYLGNIRNYLNSESYTKFTQEYYAKQILNILKSEF